jgi:hypothetical protein
MSTLSKKFRCTTLAGGIELAAVFECSDVVNVDSVSILGEVDSVTRLHESILII